MVIFQRYNIKAYDFETSQKEACFSHENDEVDPDYLSTVRLDSGLKERAKLEN